MEKDYFRISEKECSALDSKTSYSVYLSKSDIERIKLIQRHYYRLFEKQKDALSTIVRTIIENTYLYLNNMERNFNDDLKKILDKKYYENIDNKFVSKLKENTKEYDLFLELLRTQLIKLISNKEEDEELIKIQFRLTKDDNRLLRIIAGNKVHTLNDFFSGYLRYFLSLPRETQKYILTYPKGLKLDRAIKEHKCIIVDGIKYRPYKIILTTSLIRRKCLLCFDSIYDSLNVISNIYEKNIEFTEEYYEFNSYEKEVIDAYNNLDYIDISFKLLNNVSKYINRMISDEEYKNFSSIVELKHEGVLENIKIKYDERIIDILKKANKKNIDYLCFSDNYNTFIKLTEEKQKEFKRFERSLIRDENNIIR